MMSIRAVFRPSVSLRRSVLALAGAALLACGGDARARAEEGRVTVDSGTLANGSAGDSARPALADTALTPSQTTASAAAVPQPGVTTQPGAGATTHQAEPSVVPTPSSTVPAAGQPASTKPDSPAVAPPASAVLPTTPEPAAATPVTPARRTVPFGIGERFSYDVKVGPLRVGSGAMRVLGVENVRGTQAWHTSFTVKGSALGVKVDDLYESWFDVATLSSLRHLQDVDQGPYERRRTFEIFPDRKVYVEQVEGKAPREGTSVDNPLDDGSFIYFIRSLPELEVGKTYTFDNYFRPDRNPVRISVVRRERIEVPAGKFNALVLRPSIKTKGMFAEGSAEIWLSDDPARMLLQLKSRLPFGTLNLYLRNYDLHTER